MRVQRLPHRTVGAAALTIFALAIALPGRLAAQDSHLAITGLGVPEKWESVRGRSTGGAFALFDPLSPGADGALALLNRLSATAAATTSYRSLDVGGQSASLRGTRFPFVMLGGPIFSRFVLAGGFSAYLNRTFQVTIQDTVVLRGAPEPVSDEITSDGGVTDVRLALAWQPVARLRIGAAGHLLTGSTRFTVIRRFEDSTTYLPVGEVDEPRFHGYGGSAGLLLDLTPQLQLAGYVRSDATLEYTSRDTEMAYDAPFTWSAAVRFLAGRRAAFAAAVQSSAWGSAGAAINAHDTFGWSVGVELGETTSPVRLGVRGGQLPFGPGADAPTELAAALGLGFRFSGGRGLIDVALERVQREGLNLDERSWNVLLGITVRP